MFDLPHAGTGGFNQFPPPNATKVKELKTRIAELEAKLAAAEAKKMAGQIDIQNYAVQAARYEKQIEMQKTIEDAYEKGYARCKHSVEVSMAMLQTMRGGVLSKS